MTNQPIVFLLVEDSEHDLLAFQRAWRENAIPHELRVVRDGRECLDYLRRRGPYRPPAAAPRPGVIVLNDRLPRLDGQAVLATLQEEADLSYIPVILFTSSESPQKELDSYDYGANAYVVKPMTYEDLSRAVLRISRFWEMVEVPENPA